LISKKLEKEIVFKSSGLAWIRIRIEQKCWIRIKSIRIHNPGFRVPVICKIFKKYIYVELGFGIGVASRYGPGQAPRK
jgi:hypothetical protein